MRKTLVCLFAVLFCISLLPLKAAVPDSMQFDVKADSALLMDVATGTVL